MTSRNHKNVPKYILLTVDRETDIHFKGVILVSYDMFVLVTNMPMEHSILDLMRRISMMFDLFF